MCLAAISMLTGLVMDVSLLWVFKTHLQQALGFVGPDLMNVFSWRESRIRNSVGLPNNERARKSWTRSNCDGGCYK
jgi:hypothetical protein